MNETYLLVVREQPQSRESDLAPLIDELHATFSFDRYSTRQSLIGFGRSLLKRGDYHELKEITPLLDSYGVAWWLVKHGKPPYSQPAIIRNFSKTNEKFIFETAEGQFAVDHDEPMVAVLGDLTGTPIQKLVRKSAYQGERTTGTSQEELYKQILMSKPVLDLIVPDTRAEHKGKLKAVLRLIPTKFNPDALGEQKTPSAVQNFDQVIQLLKERSGSFALEMDFGFLKLPGCHIETNHLDANALQRNLKSFTYYGWYMAQMHAQKNWRPERGFRELMGGQNAAPIVAASGVGGGNWMLNELLSDEDGKKDTLPSTTGTPEPDPLPTPPLPIDHMDVRNLKKYLPLFIGAIAFVGGIYALADTDPGKRLLALAALVGVRYGVILFTFSALFFFASFRFLKLKRWIENTPTSKTRSMAMGMVELIGTAERAYNLFSPMTHVRCVYYRMRKYKKQRNPANNSQSTWVLKKSLSSGNVPFFLKDETGRVRINPQGADVRPSHKQEFFGGQLGTLLGNTITLGPDDRVVEEMIPEGSPLYVLGFARPVRGVRQSSLGARVARKLRLLKQDKERMQQYDTNQDGRIDEQEWEAAREDMEREALHDALKEKSAEEEDAEQALVGLPETKGLPFIIAAREESRLATSYGWYSGLLFVGALGTLAAGMVLLLKTIA